MVPSHMLLVLNRAPNERSRCAIGKNQPYNQERLQGYPRHSNCLEDRSCQINLQARYRFKRKRSKQCKECICSRFASQKIKVSSPNKKYWVVKSISIHVPYWKASLLLNERITMCTPIITWHRKLRSIIKWKLNTSAHNIQKENW